ncbi:MAG: vWA domain-containing protein [Planctomycetota bacterium]
MLPTRTYTHTRTFTRRLTTAALLTGLIALPTATSLAERTTPVIIPAPAAAPAPAPAPVPDPIPEQQKAPAVDIAILLDTSNSMDGLINQAKTQLWSIVNTFAAAQKDGEAPVLRVALFEYGNTRLPATEGYIRQVVPLTDDLDKLSEALFALSTSGGDEYCGQVIDEALTRLDWSKAPNAYKAIFIAGNEPFTQGEVDYKFAAGKAVAQNVILNTIHCGNPAAGTSGSWADAATLGNGDHFNIDQDRIAPVIRCPQDPIILELNTKLNQTYLWFGSRSTRKSLGLNQLKQDANAAEAAPAAAVARAQTKSFSRVYSNRGRDLVDTVLNEDGEVQAERLESIKTDDLPEAMQAMTPEQRTAHIEAMHAKRADLRKQIQQLSIEREKFLVAEKARLAAEAGEQPDMLGDAVKQAVKLQLKTKGYQVESTPATAPE